MNEEQSRRLADAADAVIQASNAVDDAREALRDARFEREVERERLAATQQMGQRLESAARRLEDAVRRGTVAAAAAGRPGVWARYRGAVGVVREGRARAREAVEADGVANKRAVAAEALARFEDALGLVAAMVFGE